MSTKPSAGRVRKRYEFDRAHREEYGVLAPAAAGAYSATRRAGLTPRPAVNSIDREGPCPRAT